MDRVLLLYILCSSLLFSANLWCSSALCCVVLSCGPLLSQNKTAADDIPSLTRSPSKVSSLKAPDESGGGEGGGGEEESKGGKMEEE